MYKNHPSNQPPETFSLSNMSPLAFFAHANVFHHGGQPVPVELSIASIPEDGTEPKVICITGRQPPHDRQRQTG
ncbi:hypothetical protein TNCV_1508981 [Trichonephila clavipes]|nr:hypothetical protein TNCV_1508981 [Trichonephila clavipes]